MSFKTNTSQDAKVFHGFTADGACFQSPEPVDNLATRAVNELVRKIRAGHLRPDETVLEISHQPQAAQRMFPLDVLGNWSTLGEYWQWPLAWTGNSATSALKYAGARCPTDAASDREWLERVSHARRIHHEPVPTQNLDNATQTLAAFLSR